jgi:uncharacterized heparinase superfamily protein
VPAADRPADVSRLAALGRLWRTVRWLRPAQLAGRARLHLLPRPRPDTRPPPPLRRPTGPWTVPAARAPSLVGPTRWRLLAEEHDLADIGWDAPSVPLLWRYNQHYFDDLNAERAAERRAWHAALLDRWLDDNPPGAGTAWAPYPTSLRLVNVLKWHAAGNTLTPRLLASLAAQVRWLSARLEWHLLGNHLFANAKALVVAGLCFEGDEAAGWLRTGLRILERELPEQFLDDGAHFELTPMYHALALEDLLDLLNVMRWQAGAADVPAPLQRALRQRAQAAGDWLQRMRHPDGTLARFNDCSEGIAPPTDDLLAYAARLGLNVGPPALQALDAPGASGYARLAWDGALAFLDLAAIGPDYLPGHAHADTLSFELSLGRQPVVVNRGTSVYGTGAQRQAERGTAAHSTLQIGAEDSSEVWAGFRVGRRARVQVTAFTEQLVEAGHDGYAHLPGRPRHQRRWRPGPRSLLVEDDIGTSGLPAVARFHLHPDLSLRPADAGWTVVDGRGVALTHATVEAGLADLERSEHAVAFGRRVPAWTLAVRLVPQQGSRVRWSW